MHNPIGNLRRALLRLHRCERGAEGLEKLLIIAAIALPLLGILLLFKGSITTWVEKAWNDMTNQANSQTPPTFNPPSGG
jgi:Flp pilus assembly pilin Flp